MNSKGKYILFLVLFSFVLSPCFGEDDNGKFYKSYEDYVNNKPMTGFRLKPMTYTFGSHDSFSLIFNNTSKRAEVETLPADFFTYNDYLLMRHEKHCYIVLVAGKFCLYSMYGEQEKLFYSNSLTGELEKYKDKILLDYLTRFNLLEEYKAEEPHAEKHDNGDSLFNRKVKRDIKYIRLINERLQNK